MAFLKCKSLGNILPADFYHINSHKQTPSAMEGDIVVPVSVAQLSAALGNIQSSRGVASWHASRPVARYTGGALPLALVIVGVEVAYVAYDRLGYVGRDQVEH